jgi:hypothetical protein
MASKNFDGTLPGWTGPCTEVVTYVVGTAEAVPIRMLYAKGAGDVVLDLVGGGTVTLTMAAKERIDYLAIERIVSTTIATPATNLLAFR